MDEFYENTPGLKMLFVNGNLYKSNVLYADNEFEYYRLIGEAYNKRKLTRQLVNKPIVLPEIKKDKLLDFQQKLEEAKD